VHGFASGLGVHAPPLGTLVSAGQAPLVPEHVSGASHSPAEALQVGAVVTN